MSEPLHEHRRRRRRGPPLPNRGRRSRIAGLVLLLVCGIAAAPPARAGGGPRLTFEGRGVLTTKITLAGPDGRDMDWLYVDASDTHLTLRLDQALFSDAIGGIALGARVTDVDSPVGPVYLYQAAIDVSSKHVAFIVGRTRRPTLAVGFPTLRDEDLIAFAYPVNPYSVGRLEEDVLFSEVISFTWWHRFRWHVQVFGEALRTTLDGGDPAKRDRFDPNAGGIRLFYDELPALAKVRHLKHLGASLFLQRADGRLPGVTRPVLWQVQSSASLGLFPDPIHLLDLRLTVLYQHGLRDLVWSVPHHPWWGQYVSGAAALRYLWAPSQVDRLQASVSVGYRRHMDRNAWALLVLPTFGYRLGHGFSVVAQYGYTRRSGQIADTLSVARHEHRLELGLSYHFELKINDTLTRPRNLLNADHEFIPVN